MDEYIACRNCDSPDCKGCNLKKLETMLNNGKLDCLMNENHCINPSVDVAPVVRCKDCKYQDDNTSCPMLNAVAYTKDDDFCCAGRRGRKVKDISCGGCGKEEKTQEEARKETQNIFLGVRFPKDGE